MSAPVRGGLALVGVVLGIWLGTLAVVLWSGPDVGYSLDTPCDVCTPDAPQVLR